MATSETLELIIKLKDSASSGLKTVQSGVTTLDTKVKKLKDKLFNLQNAFIGLAGAFVAKSLLDVATSFETYETSLKTITGSAENAEKAMDWITDFTSTTPYELDQVTQGFVSLKAYGLDPTNGTLETLGDTASAMGKDLGQAVEMFADAATGEFERLKEFGIRAKTEGDTVTFSWLENGEQMTKSVEKTGDAIQTGLIDILEGRFAGAMEEQSKTFTGMWSNIKDSFTMFQKEIMDAGLFEYLKEQLAAVLDKIQEWKEDGTLTEWATKISEAIQSTIVNLIAFGTTMASVAVSLEPVLSFLLSLSPEIILAVAALASFGLAWTTIISPIISAATAIGGVVTAVGAAGGLTAVITALGPVLLAVGVAVTAFFALWKAGEFAAAAGWFDNIGLKIETFVTEIYAGFLNAKKAVMDFFGMDTSGVDAQIAKNYENLDSLEAVKTEVNAAKAAAADPAKLDVDTTQAQSKILTIDQQFEAYKQEFATPSQVGVDTAQATTQIDQLQQKGITSKDQLIGFMDEVGQKSQEAGVQIDEGMGAGITGAAEKMTMWVDGVEVDLSGMAEQGVFGMTSIGEATTAMGETGAAAADMMGAALDAAAAETRTAEIEAALSNLESVKSQLADLVKDETKTITVTTVKKTVEGHFGGLVHSMGVLLASGGKLAGYGGGDKIRALLEAGEFVIRKEAVKKYGTGFFSALNSMMMPQTPQLAFASGGAVPAPGQVGNTSLSVPININATGSDAGNMESMFRNSIIPQLKEALANNTMSITSSLKKYTK